MKKLQFNTKTIVATGIGAALFTILFMYVKIPSPVPETNLQIAYGVSAMFGAIFGPVCGALIAFIGHALNDALLYGSPWWSWIFASGVFGLIAGCVYFKMDLENGKVNAKQLVLFNVFQAVGHLVAWVALAPLIDIIVYKDPATLAFTQGFMAAGMNIVATGIVGSLLIIAYSATKTRKGSLRKES